MYKLLENIEYNEYIQIKRVRLWFDLNHKIK